MIVRSQVTYILRFFLSRNICIARDRAWDQSGRTGLLATRIRCLVILGHARDGSKSESVPVRENRLSLPSNFLNVSMSSIHQFPVEITENSSPPSPLPRSRRPHPRHPRSGHPQDKVYYVFLPSTQVLEGLITTSR